MAIEWQGFERRPLSVFDWTRRLALTRLKNAATVRRMRYSSTD